MNPFVNPKKRSVLLPTGCKDLIDVLEGPKPVKDLKVVDEKVVQRFILLVLARAQADRATELVIGAASSRGDTPIRYRVEGTWYDMSGFPCHIRPALIREIGRLARLPAGRFPSEGIVDTTLGKLRVKWRVTVESMEAECMLRRADD